MLDRYKKAYVDAVKKQQQMQNYHPESLEVKSQARGAAIVVIIAGLLAGGVASYLYLQLDRISIALTATSFVLLALGIYALFTGKLPKPPR